MLKINLSRAWRGVLLCVASAGLATVTAWQHPRPEHFAPEHWRVREVSTLELKRISKLLVVDARARENDDEEHIPGSLLLSEKNWDEDLPQFLEQWQPEHRVVIYCDGQACAASKRIALRLLKDLPEARVYVLKGGFSAWKMAQK